MAAEGLYMKATAFGRSRRDQSPCFSGKSFNIINVFAMLWNAGNARQRPLEERH